MADDKQVTHMGYEILNKCLDCGDNDMRLNDRQELGFSDGQQKWYRRCEKCINKRRTQSQL